MDNHAKRRIILLFIVYIALLSPLYAQDAQPDEASGGRILTLVIIIAAITAGSLIAGALQKDDGKPIADTEKLAACPKCSGKNLSKVEFSKWEGKIGPKLFSLVKCRDCNAIYNGRTGTFSYVPRIISQVLFIGAASGMIFYFIYY